MPLIAFTSPKGGVGKTTIAAHVSAILRRRGHKVLAIDLDPQNALRLHLGVAMSYEAGFLCQIDQRPSWRDCAIRTPSGVDMLPFGAIDPHRAMELSAQILGNAELVAAPVRDMLAQPGLIVVLDTPPGPNAAVEALLPLMDLICLVLLADSGSAAMMPQVVSGQVYGRGTLAGRFAERTCVVMNQVDFGQELNAAVMDCAMRALGPRLLGAVCRDDALAEALAEKRLLTQGGPGAADDFQILVDQIAARLQLPPPVVATPSTEFPALTEWGLR